MPELAVAAVEQYTGGRLAQNDPETARLLVAALAAARRFCGWHVTPVVEDDEVTIDGPGAFLLPLPTLRLVELTEIAENGTDLDVDDLFVSGRGLVRKRSGAWWSGNYAAITAKMSHGFDVAPDFESAVLSFIDRTSFAGQGGRPNVIGPVQWPTEALAAGSAFSAVELALLERYRLEPSA